MPGNNEGSRFDRRTVLKTVGVAAATSATISPAVGKSKPDQKLCDKYAVTKREYNKVEVVNDAIKANLDFFDELVKPGKPLDSIPSVSDVMGTETYVNSDEGVHVWAINKPNSLEPTPHITIRRKGPSGGRVSIALKPDDTNKKPVALHKPDIPSFEGSPVDATLYRPGNQEGNTLSREKRPLIPYNIKKLRQNPELLRSLLGNSSYKTSGGGRFSTGNVGTNAFTFGCITKGDEYGGSCPTFACYNWEISCNPCERIDCTGDYCCGGCCCCDDLFFCCSDCDDQPDGCSGCNPGDDPYGCNDCPDCHD